MTATKAIGAALAVIGIATLAVSDGAGSAPPQATAAASRPNVIVILADDLGYADISAYKIDRFHTPNIDRIGMEGVRFTDGYATAPVCGPSRAGLMTGRYQDRFGFEYNNGGATSRRGWASQSARSRSRRC
jgi:arylsulfatase A-like enzyme